LPISPTPWVRKAVAKVTLVHPPGDSGVDAFFVRLRSRWSTVFIMLFPWASVSLVLAAPGVPSRRWETTASNGAFPRSRTTMPCSGDRCRTDYAIFHIGRLPRGPPALAKTENSPFYTMFPARANVCWGPGLTIAGANVCLSFCRLPYFQSLGVPCSVACLVRGSSAALNLGPSGVLTVGHVFFKLLDPKRKLLPNPGWRRIGTTNVRWPPHPFPGQSRNREFALIVSAFALPGYKTDNDHFVTSCRRNNPRPTLANAAAARQFSTRPLLKSLELFDESRPDHDLPVTRPTVPRPWTVCESGPSTPRYRSRCRRSPGRWARASEPQHPRFPDGRAGRGARIQTQTPRGGSSERTC